MTNYEMKLLIHSQTSKVALLSQFENVSDQNNSLNLCKLVADNNVEKDREDGVWGTVMINRMGSNILLSPGPNPSQIFPSWPPKTHLTWLPTLPNWPEPPAHLTWTPC